MSVNYNRFGQTPTSLEAAEGAPTTVEDKLALITRNLQEVCKQELMEKIMKVEGRDIKIYWGTATTGKPHVAYFVPMSKIADFLRAGCEVTILFADIHGYLDNMKSTFELLKYRTEYYKAIISATLTSLGVPLEKLTFRTGSEYQLTPEFTLDILKLTTLCSQRDAQKAGAEVVKQTESPPLSGLLYPIYQWLDEEYLKVDAQFGGVDQRKIFMSAEKYLPKIGYKARSHLMNKMVPGLTGEKMSASDTNSKIDLIEEEKSVKKKINKVFCEEGNVEKNPLLAFIENVVFLVHGEFTLDVRDAPSVRYTDYAAIRQDFLDKKIHPADLKQSSIKVLNSLLEPIREKFREPEMVKLTEMAYPPEVKEVKKKKEKKKAAPEGGGGAAASTAPAAAAAGGGDGGEATDMSRVLLKVGKVVSVEKHPNADGLYVEKIDLGEDEPRVVVSGLVGKIEMDVLQGALVVCVCNLKPSNLKSVKSFAMLLCASKDGVYEIVQPPAGSTPGERVTAAGHTGGAPDANIKPGSTKKKTKSVWETSQPDLKVNGAGVCQYAGIDLMTAKGPCTAATIKDGGIS